MNAFEIPSNLLYTKTHEWAKFNEDIVIVGITDYAQKSLHEIVYVDLPRIGMKVSAGKPFMNVESIKAVSEIYAPVSGEIIDVNNMLAAHPEILNENPYGDGWLVKIKPANWELESKQLLNNTQYASILKSLP